MWETRGSSLGKHITTADAAVFAINMTTKTLISTLSRADRSRAEIVTKSRAGLVVIGDKGRWALLIITSIIMQAKRMEHADGRAVLKYLPNDKDVEGYALADAAAQRVAKQ